MLEYVDPEVIRLHQEAYQAILREEREAVERNSPMAVKNRHYQRQMELRRQREARKAVLNEQARRTVAYGELPELAPDSQDNTSALWEAFCESLNLTTREFKRTQQRVLELEQSQRSDGALLVEYQARVAALKTKLKEAEAAVALTQVNVSPEQMRHAINEFIGLVSLPGVVRLEYGSDQEFHLFVNARVKHEGRLYDFGDWEIIFGRPGRRQPTMLCRRSGASQAYKDRNRIRGLPERDTPYYYPDRKDWSEWRENQFCLNFRRNTVIDYLRSGNWLEALIVAIEAIHSLDGYETRYGHTIPSVFTDLGPINPLKKRLPRRPPKAATTKKEQPA